MARKHRGKRKFLGLHVAPVADWFTNPEVRKLRVREKFKFRTARKASKAAAVKAKAEGGKWSPESTAARWSGITGLAGIGAEAAGAALGLPIDIDTGMPAGTAQEGGYDAPPADEGGGFMDSPMFWPVVIGGVAVVALLAFTGKKGG